MLNPFFIYNFITIFVFVLYIIPISKFNEPLDSILVILILVSILVSSFLGLKYKKCFEYRDAEKSDSKKLFPLLLIIGLSAFEFLYVGDIPFFSTTINGLTDYKDFESVPFLHMFNCMLAMYYSMVYIYNAISYPKNRIFNIISFFLINFMMILFNMRSFFMISLFIAINLLVAKLRLHRKIKIKHYIMVIIVSICSLYLFGCYGNMRQGFDWNDNRYIENLGLYYKWPEFIPKQYMWSYSYITSPLANLNYNITNNNGKFHVINVIYEILPVSISKRLPFFNDKNQCLLIRPYFNVSTGYCNSYANGNYFGVIFLWLFIAIFSVSSKKYIYKKNYIEFISLLCACIAFMFFNNMFSYGGTSPALWLSYLMLRNRKKIKLR